MKRRLGRARDRFWAAFWKRQQKHLPPAARITVVGCTFQAAPGEPALKIETFKVAR